MASECGRGGCRWQQYGADVAAVAIPGVPVRMERCQHRRARFVAVASGEQIGPVQSNIAPALAAAFAAGWQIQ